MRMGDAESRRRGREHHAADNANVTAPALVVFDDDTTLKWLRPLCPGFRHCFVVLGRGDHWIICNPFSHYTDLEVVHGFTSAELAAWYRHYGLRVVETMARMPPPRCAPLRPFTCVEVVKRALGLRAPWVFTPRQLHRYLVQREIADESHN